MTATLPTHQARRRLHRSPAPRHATLLSTLCLGLSLALASIPHLSARANSLPPERMTYQGFLVNANGDPLAPTTPANFQVTFRIYSEADAGALLWSELQTVTVDKGNFSVILGEGTAVPGENRPSLASVFASTTASDRYLGLTVVVSGSPLTLLPRLRLLPSPYSFLATQAGQLVNPGTGVPYVSLSGGTVSIAGTINASGGITGLTEAQVPANLLGNRTFNAGNIGIGTTTPATPLDISSASLWRPLTVRGSGGTDAVVAGNLAGRATIGAHAGALNAWATLVVNGQAGGAAGTTLIPGTVGVGTATAPGHRLEVGHSSGNVAAFWSSDSQTYVRVWDNTGFDNRVEFTSRGNGRASIWSGDDHLNVLKNGNVGVGTIKPESKLHVVGASGGQLRLELAGDGRSWRVYTEGAGDGIGGNLLFLPNAGTGKYFRRSDGAIGTLSDARLKKDVESLPPVLERLRQLRPVSFRFKAAGDAAPKTLGFIAQEVETVFPEVVGSLQDSKTLYSEMFVPISVAALQELDREVAALRARTERLPAVEKQAARVESLESEVATLRRQLQEQRQAASRVEAKLEQIELLVRAANLPALPAPAAAQSQGRPSLDVAAR